MEGNTAITVGMRNTNVWKKYPSATLYLWNYHFLNSTLEFYLDDLSRYNFILIKFLLIPFFLNTDPYFTIWDLKLFWWDLYYSVDLQCSVRMIITIVAWKHQNILFWMFIFHIVVNKKTILVIVAGRWPNNIPAHSGYLAAK